MLLWLAILAALVSLLKSRLVSRKSLGGEEARAGGEKGAGAERGRRRRTAPERDYATTCLGTPTDQPEAGSGWGPATWGGRSSLQGL